MRTPGKRRWVNAMQSNTTCGISCSLHFRAASTVTLGFVLKTYGLLCGCRVSLRQRSRRLAVSWAWSDGLTAGNARLREEQLQQTGIRQAGRKRPEVQARLSRVCFPTERIARRGRDAAAFPMEIISCRRTSWTCCIAMPSWSSKQPSGSRAGQVGPRWFMTMPPVARPSRLGPRERE